MWHGYFVVERQNIGSGNWASLRALFEMMGTHDSLIPAYNNHFRARLDGDAVIYESQFNPTEVTIDEFKQLLADEFSVPIGDIQDVQSVVSYTSVYETAVWEFFYSAVLRFTVRRFGRGGDRLVSLAETHAYFAANLAAWESVT
ncbi:MAG: hypothetical protein ACYTEQ_25120 [Planctomycetota bacterium]|jgi:hypothetical protein